MEVYKLTQNYFKVAMKNNLKNKYKMEQKYKVKAKELIDTFNYQCRECGDIDKAKIIAKQSVIETIKELDSLANTIQNGNHNDAWIFVNIIGDKIFYLEKQIEEIETYKTVSK